MNTYKTYEIKDPLKSNTKTKELTKSQMLTKEIQHRIKLIEKAFR